ncbi:MAG TPA: S4 domain-containing protein [Candidatus Binatia bacterium]|nr:S4 domain-containing protein [Candidatus Binatia bacterium]
MGRGESASAAQQTTDVRLDKWLWAARFFKSRSLASEAVAGGHVHVEGSRAKAARPVRIGEQIVVTTGRFERTVIVRALSDVRRGAPEAALLYEETAESRDKREKLAAELKAEKLAFQPGAGRPGKRDRRALQRLRGR